MYPSADFAWIHFSYLLYLGVSLALTVWVARALSRSGKLFLIRCFGQDEDLAESTNRLLVIGFYLVNLGFVCIRLQGWGHDTEDLLPAVGARVGVTLLTLGAMHFFNMLMIARMGRTVGAWMGERARRDPSTPPPVAVSPPV
jgi:hypothetical protein